MKAQRKTALGLLVILATWLSSCGGGIPVRIHIDEFTMEVSLDELAAGAFAELQGAGLIPQETQALPVLWPDNLPDIHYRTLLKTPPVPVDLTPDPESEDAEKYAQINEAQKAIKRIELNRLILRVEKSTLSVGLPELRLQLADTADADPDDRLAWRTIGILPKTEPGFVGDNEFEFIPSGESYLNAQLADDEKEFAMRVVGNVEVDTEANPRLPAGKAAIRLIVVATFFVEPVEAANAAKNVTNGGGGGEGDADNP